MEIVKFFVKYFCCTQTLVQFTAKSEYIVIMVPIVSKTSARIQKASIIWTVVNHTYYSKQ